MAELAVAIAKLVQRREAQEGRHRPLVPRIGLLRPRMRAGRPIWVSPGGQEFCELGQMFDRRAEEKR